MREVVANVHRKGILKLNIHRHGVTFHRSLSSGYKLVIWKLVERQNLL